MNSRYWGKTVIKLLNLTNSVYNFSNIDSKIGNSGIKTSTLAREHLSTQDTWARKDAGHVSTFLARRARNLADSANSS